MSLIYESKTRFFEKFHENFIRNVNVFKMMKMFFVFIQFSNFYDTSVFFIWIFLFNNDVTDFTSIYEKLKKVNYINFQKTKKSFSKLQLNSIVNNNFKLNFSERVKNDSSFFTKSFFATFLQSVRTSKNSKKISIEKFVQNFTDFENTSSFFNNSMKFLTKKSFFSQLIALNALDIDTNFSNFSNSNVVMKETQFKKRKNDSNLQKSSSKKQKMIKQFVIEKIFNESFFFTASFKRNIKNKSKSSK